MTSSHPSYPLPASDPHSSWLPHIRQSCGLNDITALNEGGRVNHEDTRTQAEQQQFLVSWW